MDATIPPAQDRQEAQELRNRLDALMYVVGYTIGTLATHIAYGEDASGSLNARELRDRLSEALSGNLSSIEQAKALMTRAR